MLRRDLLKGFLCLLVDIPIFSFFKAKEEDIIHPQLGKYISNKIVYSSYLPINPYTTIELEINFANGRIGYKGYITNKGIDKIESLTLEEIKQVAKIWKKPLEHVDNLTYNLKLREIEFSLHYMTMGQSYCRFVSFPDESIVLRCLANRKILNGEF